LSSTTALNDFNRTLQLRIPHNMAFCLHQPILGETVSDEHVQKMRVVSKVLVWLRAKHALCCA